METFHMTNVDLGCIGKYLKGSGAEIILIEKTMFGPNVIKSVMTNIYTTKSYLKH